MLDGCGSVSSIRRFSPDPEPESQGLRAAEHRRAFVHRYAQSKLWRITIQERGMEQHCAGTPAQQ
jgi:hypothetical protein